MKKAMNKLLTVIVFLLAFSMLVLWINYITLRFDKNTKNNSAVLDGNFWIFTGTSHSSTDAVADEYFFSPLSVSLILSSEGYTSAYNERLTQILYDGHKHLLNEVFSSSYVCAPSDEESWNEVLKISDGVFIDYPAPLPFTIISLFNGKTDSFAVGDACNVKSVMLYNNANNELSAMAKDGRGGIYSFKLKEDSESPSLVYDFNSNNLAAYTVNKGFTQFIFNNNAKESQKSEKLEEEYKILSSAPSLTAIITESPLQNAFDMAFSEEENSYLELVSEKALSSILTAFEINPNIVGYYSDPSYGLFFVGDKITLSITPSGVIEYASTDKDSVSLSVASLLNSEKTSFTANEYLTAATTFLGRFPTSMTGGDATPVLCDIFYSPKTREFSFEFIYHFNLCEILENEKNAKITLTFSKNGLSYARIQSLNVIDSEALPESEGKYLDMSMTPMVVSKMLIHGGEFAPVYNYGSYGETVIPLWMEKVKGGADK